MTIDAQGFLWLSSPLLAVLAAALALGALALSQLGLREAHVASGEARPLPLAGAERLRAALPRAARVPGARSVATRRPQALPCPMRSASGSMSRPRARLRPPGGGDVHPAPRTAVLSPALSGAPRRLQQPAD
jgi:hypothetical protein